MRYPARYPGCALWVFGGQQGYILRRKEQSQHPLSVQLKLIESYHAFKEAIFWCMEIRMENEIFLKCSNHWYFKDFFLESCVLLYFNFWCYWTIKNISERMLTWIWSSPIPVVCSKSKFERYRLSRLTSSPVFTLYLTICRK